MKPYDSIEPILPALYTKVYTPSIWWDPTWSHHFKLCSSDAEVHTMITLVELIPDDKPQKKG
tara:strand:+ start:883 stop:1068 length:186 start_codon:yes stop_codon:yes gene_type:complete